MSIFKKIRTLFSDNSKRSTPYEDFWNWFKNNEKHFYRILKQKGDINDQFFDPLLEKLNSIREGYYFLAGMNGDTAELVFTADGKVKNIVFVEDLVAAAPVIAGWEFIASKPAVITSGQSIRMGDFEFNNDNLFFYADDHPHYPDCINLTVVHDDYTTANEETMVMGTYIFLDNFLGEVKSVTMIDSVNVTGRDQASGDLIPIGKLKDYIEWRQKEFVERYDGVAYDKVNDNYYGMEAETDDGSPILIIVNGGVLNWDGTASHPWILKVVFEYNGADNHGLPEQAVNDFMNHVEDELGEMLPVGGSLNVGRETGMSKRIVFFPCRDFREPSRVAEMVSRKYAVELAMSWDIYKDKYWQSLERFKIA